MSPWAAVILAAALSWLARVAGWLTPGGARAATAVGAVVFAGAGLAGAVLIALLFGTGSWLTYGSPRRGRRGRSAPQVVANGGWAAVGAVLAWGGSPAGWAVLAGSLAAAQADTWATEIGAGAARAPRLITTGQPVPRGTSGGVSIRGTAGGVAGALVMGLAAAAAGLDRAVAIAAAVGGTVGMLGDSLLGATVQAMYRCERCGEVGETPAHACGGTGRRVRGAPWIDNDVVNMIASGLGGAVAVGIAAVL